MQGLTGVMTTQSWSATWSVEVEKIEIETVRQDT